MCCTAYQNSSRCGPSGSANGGPRPSQVLQTATLAWCRGVGRAAAVARSLVGVGDAGFVDEGGDGAASVAEQLQSRPPGTWREPSLPSVQQATTGASMIESMVKAVLVVVGAVLKGDRLDGRVGGDIVTTLLSGLTSSLRVQEDHLRQIEAKLDRLAAASYRQSLHEGRRYLDEARSGSSDASRRNEKVSLARERLVAASSAAVDCGLHEEAARCGDLDRSVRCDAESCERRGCGLPTRRTPHSNGGHSGRKSS